MTERMDPVQAAVVEIVGMADLYRRIQDTCWTKCVADVKESTLDAGESSCLDRCVNKYTDVHTIVGKELQTNVPDTPK
ncbi:putative TIM10 family protein [Toxoplasma gondii TgCatPRC2]|uniref:Mitochondrial import inner membrane translocase subunit n=13 Tax=Toxoplasma gondii TaxID=5811 RepID=B9PZS6_TOXGV|nr:putative TIM10 family protein [Toxoplasma gondii GT1]ESS31222.1 putative TIM10 family protein [Toxoplasma gondii VEG]KFG41358.1 putative TIM10 family protein [Toxoplasma gondii p89]KFG52850.1 putative TIM10 family protein [Toxoplasma gondii FOU]KFG62155.1 putative TIM10 family protein [Toxoplasma gondii RUB]KFH07975.1 putative TIM10 family protein [Toxoplasma gondii VAND]KFH16513.1 putative TIM10 family protein [Toxoplasma gondii MAS]KYF42840.1 putative TIM10 family protein [Toxoplasma go